MSVAVSPRILKFSTRLRNVVGLNFLPLDKGERDPGNHQAAGLINRTASVDAAVEKKASSSIP
jgi:hypothetical protein